MKQLKENSLDGFCVDHIHTLRIIIEQSMEFQSPVYTSFIDFEQAFENVKHESNMENFKMYGTPDKIINIMKGLYENVECVVEDMGESLLSSPVCQKCTL